MSSIMHNRRIEFSSIAHLLYALHLMLSNVKALGGLFNRVVGS